MEQQQRLAGFAVAFHGGGGLFVRNRQPAGIGDHVENQQIALRRQIGGGEAGPIVFDEFHLRIIRRDHLVSVSAGKGIVMVVRNKQHHFRTT
ncbi:hypothetical protein SDC9_195851 [bioreactor metagenome]|uniref:Uncharacterized protein n=1 Tax=bioreactor metagenome TaxID=1076179 RepID=A0A645IBE2_9ZZZZ